MHCYQSLITPIKAHLSFKDTFLNHFTKYIVMSLRRKDNSYLMMLGFINVNRTEGPRYMYWLWVILVLSISSVYRTEGPQYMYWLVHVLVGTCIGWYMYWLVHVLVGTCIGWYMYWLRVILVRSIPSVYRTERPQYMYWLRVVLVASIPSVNILSFVFVSSYMTLLWLK